MSNWTIGYNNGLTGPSTPSFGGVTCGESCEIRNWEAKIKKWEKDGEIGAKPPFPKSEHIPISIGKDTIAIVVGPERETNAKIIGNAKKMLEFIESLPKMSEIYEGKKTELLQKIRGGIAQ